MKLYTKKNIWAVLAMGLMVCSSVDAGVVKRKQRERCAGAIIDAARNAGAKGTVTMAEIYAHGKKCTYTGRVPGVPTSTSYAFRKRRHMLRQYQKYIMENDECDPEETVCLIDTGEDMKKAQIWKRVGAAFGATGAAAGAAAGAGAAATAATIGAASATAVTGTVLAVGAAPALVVAGAVAGARGAQNTQCKKTCQGFFVNSANKKGVNVLIDKSNVQHMIQGVGRNRKCLCKYIGLENGFSRNATFLQRKARKDKKTAELKLYAGQAKAETCNLLNETCIGDIPKDLNDTKQCILAFWQYGKDNGLRGTITTEHHIPVKAKKQSKNEIKCTYDGSIQAMPKSLTIKNDPKNYDNIRTYAAQVHLGNKVCKGAQSICLFKGQR
jgi:hypothetical protein